MSDEDVSRDATTYGEFEPQAEFLLSRLADLERGPANRILHPLPPAELMPLARSLAILERRVLEAFKTWRPMAKIHALTDVVAFLRDGHVGQMAVRELIDAAFREPTERN